MILQTATQEELLKLFKMVTENSKGDFWLPLASLGGLFGIIITLIIVILSMIVKNNDKRQDRNEKTLGKIEDNQTALRMLTEKFDERLESHQGQISDNRQRIKDLA